MKEKLQPTQGRALAHLVHALKPEWSSDGIFKAIGEAVESGQRPQDSYHVAVALILMAAEGIAKYPKAIAFPGDHWKRAERALGFTPAPEKYVPEDQTGKSPMPPNFRELARAEAERIRNARKTGTQE